MYFEVRVDNRERLVEQHMVNPGHQLDYRFTYPDDASGVTHSHPFGHLTDDGNVLQVASSEMRPAEGDDVIDTGRLRRWLQATAGTALVALGLSGLTGLWEATASAQPADPGRSHVAMHEMMDAMHGEGTAERMHEIEGAEQMMDQCASMMTMMGDMDTSRMRGMMDGRGMGGMMGSR